MPRSLHSGVLGVGCSGARGKVKFQSFMQKSFICKAHLQILPPCVLFPYYIFPPATQSLLQLFFPCGAPPSCRPLLVDLQVGPLGLAHQRQVKALCSAPRTDPWELCAEHAPAGLSLTLAGLCRAPSLRLLLRPSGSQEPLEQ